MATVDLDKLSEELTAAGWAVEQFVSGEIQFYRPYNQKNTEGVIDENGHVGFTFYDDWEAIDIIRRHVSPVAPDDAVREAIAKRMFADADAIAVEHGDKPVRWEDYEHQDWYYRRADSALSVLAERGIGHDE